MHLQQGSSGAPAHSIRPAVRSQHKASSALTAGAQQCARSRCPAVRSQQVPRGARLQQCTHLGGAGLRHRRPGARGGCAATLVAAWPVGAPPAATHGLAGESFKTHALRSRAASLGEHRELRMPIMASMLAGHTWGTPSCHCQEGHWPMLWPVIGSTQAHAAGAFPVLQVLGVDA